MSIPITCTCGRKFAVADSLRGKQVQCQCGNGFVVPDGAYLSAKEAYKLGWRQFAAGMRRRLTPFPLTMLWQELLCCWGFLIAKESEASGVSQFAPLQATYQEWQQTQQQLAAEPNARKQRKLAFQLYRLSQQIGEYCHKENYSFGKISSVAHVEKQFLGVDTTLRCQRRSDNFWRLAARELPLLLRFSTLFTAIVAVVVTTLAVVLWQCALPAVISAAIVGAIVVALGLPWIYKNMLGRTEKARLSKVWHQYTLTASRQEFIFMETVVEWSDHLFGKRWKKWLYQPAVELQIPEDLSTTFIPDVAFPDNNAAEFGVEWNEEMEAWCQKLYQSCQESFSEPGSVHFCFIYSENLPRINRFVRQLHISLGELNNTQGEELLAIGRYACTSSLSLSSSMALLEDLLQPQQFQSDLHFRSVCHMFTNLSFMVKMHTIKNIASETADGLKTPVCVETFAALRDAVYTLAQRKPTLLIVEHLDYSDPLSLQFLCSLTQEKRTHRVCFLVSYTRENVAKIAALKEMILTLQAQRCWRTPETETAEHQMTEYVINKSKEWQTLEKMLRQVSATPCMQIVGLQGESGRGKSFLVRKVLEKCTPANNFNVFTYTFHASASEDPYILLPIKKMFDFYKENRAEIDQNLAQRIAAIAEFMGLTSQQQDKEKGFPWRGTAGQEFSQALASFDKTNMSEQEIGQELQKRLWNELVQIICMLSTQKPIVLFLDDFHSVDLATLRFLEYMVLTAPQAHLGVILTWDRIAMPKSNMALKDFFEQLKNNNNCYAEVTLETISPAAITSYIAEGWKPNLLAESADSPFIKRLCEITNRNPLLLTEYLKYLLLTKAFYPFCGFWVLKEELPAQQLTVKTMIDKFTATLDSGQQKLFSAMLREGAVYGQTFPIEYINKNLRELGFLPDDMQKVMDRVLPNSMLLQAANKQGYVEFVHPEYRQAIYLSMPSEQRKEMHQKVLAYCLGSGSVDHSHMLYQAEESQMWDQVLNLSEVVGRHCIDLFELNTAASLFDKGILAAQNTEDLSALAKYYLLKAHTFPSLQAKVSADVLKTALMRKQWELACQLSPKFKEKDRTCQIFLEYLDTLERKDRDEITRVASHVLSLLPEVESEYTRIQFLQKLIPFFSCADPLQLRSLAERCIPVAEQIYDVESRGKLYLLLQKQLGEMDLEIIRTISSHISPFSSGPEKAISIYYVASFLPQNLGMLDALREEAEEISNRIYQIMALRGVAEYLLAVSPAKAVELFSKITQAILDISVPARRVEAIEALFTGKHGDIAQKDFDKLLSALAEDARSNILHALLEVVQQTPEVTGRLGCLNKLSVILLKNAQGEQFEKVVQDVIQELKKIQDPVERGNGFLEIASAIVQENIHLANQYLEEGVREIENIYATLDRSQIMPAEEKILRMLNKIMQLLQKLPQTLVYPLWDRTISITQMVGSANRDPLFSDMVVHLFAYDQDRAMQLAMQIQTPQYRQQTVKRLLALPAKVVNMELLEQVILEKGGAMYGDILLQELAEKDLGRARRLLKYMPDCLETKIASARLFRPPGQRVREVLKLAQGLDTESEDMQKIGQALENLMRRKEYDRDGNHAVWEMIPDGFPGKIGILMAMTFSAQEADPLQACEAFVRVPPLVAKYLSENDPESPYWRKELATIEELLQQLLPQFVHTYITRLAGSLNIIPLPSVKALFLKGLCQKLKDVSPEAFLNVVEKIAEPEIRFQLLENFEKKPKSIEPDMGGVFSSSLTHGNVEALVPLSMIDRKSPETGQVLRQIITENIVSYRDPIERMGFWIKALEANAGWDLTVSEFCFSKILEDGSRLPIEEITPYYKLIYVLEGLPAQQRNDFLTRLIDHLVVAPPQSGSLPVLSLAGERFRFWNALRIFQAILPFGPSHVHSFVSKLLTIRNSGDFSTTIDAIMDFLFLTRGLCPEKESEWIADAIGYLDTVSEDIGFGVVQEDYFLLRAMNMVNLAKDLIIYQPIRALRSAQRVIQLTEYSTRRHRFHRYILLQLSSLLDYMQREIQEKMPDAVLPLKVMRLQCAYSHLQALKEVPAEERRKFLQDEKNTFKEIINSLLAYLEGKMPLLDSAEAEEMLVSVYQQLKDELEQAFQKLLVAKPGPGLVQAFFVVAQSLCLMDDESLRNWPTPWFHRMVRISARIDASKLSIAGDDILKADEREEFAALVQRVALIFPRSVLLLIKGMLGAETISEIPSTLEEDDVSPELLKTLIPSIDSNFLRHYRDRLLAMLTLEWTEYSWKDGFLLASMIVTPELMATTLRRLVRKSCDYYPQDLTEICNKAFTMLQRVKNSREKTACLAEIAVHLVHRDVHQTLEVIHLVDSQEKQVEIWQRIISNLEWESGLVLVKQIPLAHFRVVCLRTLLCGLPSESDARVSCVERIWEIAQGIREDGVRVELMKEIIRIGLREQDIQEQMRKIGNMLLEMWENVSHVEKELSFQFICSTFPVFMHLVEDSMVESLFNNLADQDYLPILANYQEKR